MKNVFALFQLIFGFGFFAAIAAHIGHRLPFDWHEFMLALGAYAAVGLVVIALHDYTRHARLRRRPPPPSSQGARLPQPSPAAPLSPSGAAVWAHRTLSA